MLAAEDEYWHDRRRGAVRPAVVGEIFFALRSLANQTAEIGWVFHPAAAGQGYATEAAAGVLDLAFGPFGLHRVIAQLDPANERIVALCRRLGMRHEALFRQDVWSKGAWGDTVVYATPRRGMGSADLTPRPA